MSLIRCTVHCAVHRFIIALAGWSIFIMIAAYITKYLLSKQAHRNLQFSSSAVPCHCHCHHQHQHQYHRLHADSLFSPILVRTRILLYTNIKSDFNEMKFHAVYYTNISHTETSICSLSFCPQAFNVYALHSLENGDFPIRLNASWLLLLVFLAY